LGLYKASASDPFVARIAKQLNLTGFVLNSGHGVYIEVQGEEHLVKVFEEKIE